MVRGWPAARVTLRQWGARPIAVLAPWVAISFGIACVLLGLVWLVGANSPADPTRIDVRRLLEVQDEWLVESWYLFRNNLLVLALHAMACLAGFIVHLALTDPVDAEHPRIAAWSRSLAIVAVAFVPIATVLSITTQAWVLGSRASTLSAQLHLPVPTVLWTTILHSLPELAAVFLPLAASMYLIIARGRPDQLLAATVATVVIAIPVVAASAVVESRVWPSRLVAARAAHPHLEGSYLGELEVDPSDLHAATATLTAGPQLGGTFDDRAAAIARARRHPGGATVVIEMRDRYVVQELVAVRHPHLCDTLSGMVLKPRPIAMSELERLFLSPSRPLRDGVVAFVGGSTVLEPADLAPPDVERSFPRHC